MVMINHQGVIEMVNAQAERVFGYERRKCWATPSKCWFPNAFGAIIRGLRDCVFPRSAVTAHGRRARSLRLRKDGSEFPVEIGLNPIETEEGTMVLSAIVDISDRKHREEGIRGALREKEMLLGEIHHRVKNNLQIVHSLLDLQSTNIKDEIVLGMMQESQNRIRSMALIHETLYKSKDFARVDFRSFLDMLVPTLISSYAVGNERIAVSINSGEVLLPINAAIPCGLVVNELISNALKHGFPRDTKGGIAIELSHDGPETVILSVSDSGVGISEAFDITRTATLGLQLVTMLTDQLAGELTIRRSHPTRFAIRFPIPEEGGRS